MDAEGTLPCSQMPRARPLSQGRRIQPTHKNPISIRHTLMPPFHLLLKLPSGLFPPDI